MNKSIFILAAAVFVLGACSGKKGVAEESMAVIETDFGKITVRLYDSTPKHKENFVRLVREGYYDGLLFHRVIQGFMMQGGDPGSKNAPAGAMLGNGGPGYTVPAEIGRKHFKGALAAARMGDAANPHRASSGSQFYIVQGKPVGSADLQQMAAASGVHYTPEEMQTYAQRGGTPFLDGAYTVFGEVVEGMEVIDAICSQPCDPANRPLKDVSMKIRMR